MLAKLSSLVARSAEQKEQKGFLDLSIEDGELQAAFEAAVVEGGRASLCAVLRRCAERPSVLSIVRTDGEPERHLLPHVLMELHTAADHLTELAEPRRSHSGRGAGPPLLPWAECEGALALLHGGSALFVQLAAVPQHRRLLQQHGLPAALQHVMTALVDCMQRLGGGADGGGAGGASCSSYGNGSGDDNGGGGGGGSSSSWDEEQRQQLVVLGALEAVMLLLGCLWQAGFAAVHAAPSGAEAPLGAHRQPSALRLPRDVEALLMATDPKAVSPPLLQVLTPAEANPNPNPNPNLTLTLTCRCPSVGCSR